MRIYAMLCTMAQNEALRIFRQLLPHLAGRLTLAEFTLLAVAILDVDPEPVAGDVHQVLLQEGGNVSAAARRLGVATKTVYRRLAKSGKDIVEIRTSGPS